MYVRPFQWEIRDVGSGNDSRINIYCWAHNRDSESVLINIKDYHYECSLSLPMYIDNKFVKWNQVKINEVMDIFKDEHKLKFLDNYTLAYKEKFYFHQKFPIPLIITNFANKLDMFRFINFINNISKTEIKGCYQIFESDFSPHRKLLTERNITYSDWMMFEGSIPNEKISTCTHEYNISYKSLSVLDVDTSSWVTYASYLSVDLECYSHNSRKFPDAYSIEDAVFMVSCVYQKSNDPSSRINYGIVIGECDDMPHIDNTIIIKVKNEIELYKVFGEVVNITNPDIITGWNIFKFDFTYMNTRMESFDLDWPCMSRIKSDFSVKTEFYSKSWRSGAYGKIVNAWPKMAGRISMDALSVFKREYPGRNQYKLDVIAKEFLGHGEGKEDVSPQEIFKAYELSRKITEQIENNIIIDSNDVNYLKNEMGRVMSYCIRDSAIVIDLLIKQNIFESLIQMSIVVGVPILTVYSGGQQQRCYSQIYHYAHKNNYVMNKIFTKSNKYAGGSVCDPIPGYHEDVLCLDFSSLYPSIMIAFNICHTTLIKDIEKFKDLDSDSVNFFNFMEKIEVEEENDDEDNFMLVGKKKKVKIVEQEVKEFFVKQNKKKGIIPMILEDLINQRKAVKIQMANHQKEVESYFSIIQILDDLRNNNFNNFNYDECQKDFEKAKDHLKESARMRFYISHCLINNADYSDIFNTLSIQEANYREKIFDLQNLVKKLSEREKGIKVSTNSYYGFLGVHENGTLPLIEGAKVVTFKGRQMVNTAAYELECEFPVVRVYGDTDSVMMKVDTTKIPKNKCHDLGKDMAEFINGVKKGDRSRRTGEIATEYIPGLFKSDRLQMELEKVMDMILFRKKKYAAWLKDSEGNYILEKIMKDNIAFYENKLLKKGIDIARRDNCSFFKKTYTKALILCLQKKPFIEVFNSIINDLNDLLEGRINYSELSIVVGINDFYKQRSNQMNIFKEYLNDEGIHVSGGDRLEFVITNQVSDTKGSEIKVGHKLRLVEQIKAEPDKYTIDYDYYINKKLCNPLNQLLNVVYKQEIEMTKAIMTFKKTPRSKTSYLDKAVTFYSCIRSKKTHQECVNFFNYNYSTLENIKNNIESNVQRNLDFFNGDFEPYKQEVDLYLRKMKETQTMQITNLRMSNPRVSISRTSASRGSKLN